jgi:succinylglutamate desuccinylase
MSEIEGVVRKEGASAGKTVAIFGGMHGNETVGARAVHHLVSSLNPLRGTVYLVYANPPAIDKGVRLINTNLNRLFHRDISGDTYEYRRATELMDLLDTCDALLDIHSYNSETGDQFLITEENGLELASKLDFPLVATGFTAMGSGSDSYMSNRGKVGLTAECGTTNRADHFFPLAVKTALQFLQHFGNIDEVEPFNHVPQRRVRAERMILKKTDSFTFSREYKDFEQLGNGEVFATDGDITHTAGEGECIIFPRVTAPVGGEACIIGKSY